MKFLKDNTYLEYIKDFKLIKNKNLSKQIYKVLLKLITKDILKSNTLILEYKISLILNVSKTPVREALKKLENDNLLKILPQSKTYVLPINLEKVISYYKIREALELLLIEEAIKKIKNDDLKIFYSIIEKQELALKNDNFDSFFEYDNAFHFQIAKIAKLSDAWDILEKINIHISRIRYITTNDYKWNKDVLIEHKNILKALKQKNINLAKTQMSIHLSRVSEIIKLIMINKKE